jgi:uncharacterized RDD family membrane protein YckC
MPYCAACGGYHADDAGYCPFCGAPVGSTPAVVVYSGFWRRVAGLIIDSLVIGIPFSVLTSIVGGNGLKATTTTNHATGTQVTHFHLAPGRFFGLLLLQLAVAGAYSAILQSSSRQATLGQMALGIRVTDLAGGRITLARGVGRYLGYLLSDFLLGLGNLVMLFTERKQALQDLLAGTLVVRARE